MTETVGSSRQKAPGVSRKGLAVDRVYTTAGTHPYDEVTWERRDVVLTNWRDGSVNFEQRGVEFPDFWSANATNIVTTKYFRGSGRHPAARDEFAPTDRPGCAHLRQSRQGQRLLRDTSRCRDLRARADVHALAPGIQLQQSGLVQRRHQRTPASFGVFHPVRR